MLLFRYKNFRFNQVQYFITLLSLYLSPSKQRSLLNSREIPVEATNHLSPNKIAKKKKVGHHQKEKELHKIYIQFAESDKNQLKPIKNSLQFGKNQNFENFQNNLN